MIPEDSTLRRHYLTEQKYKTEALKEIQESIDRQDAQDRKSTRLNSSHIPLSRMPSSA